MRVIATTVVRESIRGKQRTGSIFDIDWDAGTVSHSLPAPEPRYPESDDNPRGGVRGGRGVVATREGIIVANYDSLVRYDDEWNVLGEISHPLFVGIHEIDWDGSHVWISATGIDAVLRCTLDGDVDVAWDPHGTPIAERFRIRPRVHPIDGSVDYRTREAPLIDRCHLNGVARFGEHTLVNCGLMRPSPSGFEQLVNRVKAKLGQDVHRKKGKPRGAGIVVRLDGNGRADLLVELGGHDVPTHNGQQLDEGRVAINDSTKNTLRVFDVKDGRELQSLEMDGSWLRGMEPLPGNRVLVGIAPGTVVEVDLATNAPVRSVQLSENTNEAVHGLIVCPPPGERL